MDRRSKRHKLEAMANQVVSPHEAEIAKSKLEEMGPEIEVAQPQAASFTVNISYYYYPISGVHNNFWNSFFYNGRDSPKKE